MKRPNADSLSVACVYRFAVYGLGVDGLGVYDVGAYGLVVYDVGVYG